MFEDSLVESRLGVVSSSKRWTMLASIGLQVAAAGVVITLPLLHPEALPFRYETPKVLMPLIPKPRYRCGWITCRQHPVHHRPQQ